MDVDADIAHLAQHFADGPQTFTTSPLYQALSPAVAADRPTLELLTERRPGQQASYLFFGAVHALLLAGSQHSLREFYPSIVGAAARDPSGAGPHLIDFRRTHHDELAALIRTRMVQTNVVRRALALRYALWAIGRTERRPVHLIEVGASAGMLLLVDRYGYRLGGHRFGPADAVVTLDTDWRGTDAPPDLDDVPRIASRIGIDLNPIDATRAEERSWLRALVWPEDDAEAVLLGSALGEVSSAAPVIIEGDAIDVLPRLARDLPSGEPRVAFHAATRMHVPAARRAAFDEAIDAIGSDGSLYHVWLEPASAPHDGYSGDERGVVAMHGPEDRRPTSLVQAEGHLHWLKPLP